MGQSWPTKRPFENQFSTAQYLLLFGEKQGRDKDGPMEHPRDELSSNFEKNRLWAPFWMQLGSEWGPQIGFACIMLAKSEKREVPKRDRKKLEKIIEDWFQNGRLRDSKTGIPHYTCCKTWVFGESWDLMKNGRQNYFQNHLETIIFDLGASWKGVVFWCVCWSATNRSKIAKFRKKKRTCAE